MGTLLQMTTPEKLVSSIHKTTKQQNTTRKQEDKSRSRKGPSVATAKMLAVRENTPTNSYPTCHQEDQEEDWRVRLRTHFAKDRAGKSPETVKPSKIGRAKAGVRVCTRKRTCTQGHAHVDLLLVVEHFSQLDDVWVVELLKHRHLLVSLFAVFVS